MIAALAAGRRRGAGSRGEHAVEAADRARRCTVCQDPVLPGQATQGSIDGRHDHHACVAVADSATRPRGGD